MYLSRDFDIAFNPSTLSRLAHFNFDCFFSIWICKKRELFRTFIFLCRRNGQFISAVIKQIEFRAIVCTYSGHRKKVGTQKQNIYHITSKKKCAIHLYETTFSL